MKLLWTTLFTISLTSVTASSLSMQEFGCLNVLSKDGIGYHKNVGGFRFLQEYNYKTDNSKHIQTQHRALFFSNGEKLIVVDGAGSAKVCSPIAAVSGEKMEPFTNSRFQYNFSSREDIVDSSHLSDIKIKIDTQTDPSKAMVKRCDPIAGPDSCWQEVTPKCDGKLESLEETALITGFVQNYLRGKTDAYLANPKIPTDCKLQTELIKKEAKAILERPVVPVAAPAIVPPPMAPATPEG